MEGGIGDGALASASSFRMEAGSLSAVGGKLFGVSRLRGVGRGVGWNEFRRLEEPREGGWLVDLRLVVGGVESVRVVIVGLP